VPATVQKSREDIIKQSAVLDIRKNSKAYVEPERASAVADPVVQVMDRAQLQKAVEKTRKAMYNAAKELEFLDAARLRVELQDLEQLFAEKYG
jgi:excinuclease ABC subunit B